MPMTWTEPEVFLIHNGVTVYHAYKDGNADHRLTYHYTTSKHDEEGFTFDVRDLHAGDDSLDGRRELDHDPLIRFALDNAEIPYPEDEIQEEDDYSPSPPTPDEFVLRVEGGNRIVGPSYPGPCDYVRVLDDNDVELAYWDSLEWSEDPAGVMGAILGCAAGSKD